MAALNAMSGKAKQNNKPAQLEFSNRSWAITHSILLALCCFFSYKIITGVLGFSHFVPRDDELLGGMWAVIATIFVFRSCYEESIHAALSRTLATSLSFVLCLAYLLAFPFRLWGLVLLIATESIVLELIGRSEDIITASITTTVVMVVAGISPEHAWRQPVLRFLDTLVGIAVGVLGAWFGLALARRIPSQSSATLRET
jgi:hypothetical protein